LRAPASAPLEMQMELHTRGCRTPEGVV